MNTEEYKNTLVDLFPEFESYWESEDNIYKHDQFNIHSVTLCFCEYFKFNYKKFTEQQMSRLFEFVEKWVSKDPDDKLLVSNALCTCFLENIAQSEAGDASKKYLGKDSLEYFKKWES